MENAHLKKRERWVQMSKDELKRILKQKKRAAITSKSARTDVKLIVRMLKGREQLELLINPPESLGTVGYNIHNMISTTFHTHTFFE